MSELTHPHSAARAPSRLAGYAWFAGMVGGWVAFYVLMMSSEPTLGELQDRVRALPLLLEGLIWLAFFPYVLALTIWGSGWSDALRFALVTLCAVGWSLTFYPWRKARASGERRAP